jgi:hypothetical protein
MTPTQTTAQPTKKSKKAPAPTPADKKLARSETVKITPQLLSTSAEGYPLLGECAYWSLSDINLPFAEFVAKLKAAGIDEKYAGRVRSKSALIRALQKETATREDCFYRALPDAKDVAVFVIVKQQMSGGSNHAVNFSTDTQVIFDKETGVIKVEGYRAAEVQTQYDAEQGAYNTDNMRKVILDFLYSDCQAVSVRENGGIYFVPNHKREQFTKVQEFFKNFTGCSINVLPLIDTVEAKKAMWKSLVGEVEAELAAQKKQLADPDQTPSTERGVESRVRKYQELKGKVEMYETLLTGTAEGLKKELDDLTVLVKGLIS